MGKNTGKFAIGALVAGAVGYVAGILTAPKSGKETRKDIHDAAVKAKTEAEKKLKELHSELSKLIDKGAKEVQTLKEKAKKELDGALKKAGESRQKAREVLSAVRDGQADDRDLQKAIEDVRESIDHLNAYLKK